jgi:glycosyltransferase involved in cell wall biosynthesis
VKKHKILLTNRRLDNTGGTESFCLALSKALSSENEVYIYSPKHGVISEQISKYANILREPEGTFDIILYNHNNTVLPNFHAKCKVYTIHGLYHELEEPPESVDAYVAISNEIKKNYKHLNPHLIQNSIDTDVFRPLNERSRIRTLLYVSNYENNFSNLLQFVALSLKMRYARLGWEKTKKFNIIDEIQSAHVVVGVGRTVLEAMSCNKKVIVADKRSYADYGMDGFLNQENVQKSAFSNYSGRAYKKPMNFLSMRKEIKKAINDRTSWERDWIENNHNIKQASKDYVHLAEQLIEKENK